MRSPRRHESPVPAGVAGREFAGAPAEAEALRPSLRVRALILAAVACAATAPALAVDAPIAADASVPSAGATGSGRSALTVSAPDGATYLAFDLSTLPSGVTGVDIGRATLRLWVREVRRPGTAGVRLVDGRWSETSLDSRNAPGVIDVEVARATVESSSVDHFIVFDVTEAVRVWADGGLPNDGFAVVADGAEGAFTFDSKESASGGHEPRLEITLGAFGGQTAEQPIGLDGVAGPAGDPGPAGPDGIEGSALNPQKIALLDWTRGNTTGITFPMGTHPITVIYAGGALWVVDFETDQLRKVDPATGSIIGTFAVGDGPAYAASDGRYIWVTNDLANTVTRLRLADGSLVDTLPTGNAPTGIGFDGVDMWIVNNLDDTISRRRVSDGATLNTYPTCDGPRRVAMEGPNIWIPCTRAASVYKLRRSDGAFLASYGGFSRPTGIAFDGVRMWVVNFDVNTVSATRVSDGVTDWTIPVGQHPFGVAFDGKSIWVTNSNSDSVTKIRASDGTVIGTYAAGWGPEGIAFDGAKIWTGNTGNGTLSLF